jgi:hypothetical protein
VFDLVDVPAILDEALWERVCDRLANEYIPRPTVKRMLSGILVCPTCHYTMSGNISAKGAARYACRKRPGKPDACGTTGALCAPVDAVVGAKMIDFLNDRERVTTLLRQLAPGPELDAVHARNAELNESLLALDQAAYNPPPGQKRLPPERYNRLLEQIETEQRELNRKLAVSREAAILAETLNEEWTPEAWADKPMDWKRLVIGLATVEVSIEPRSKIAVRDARGRNTFDPERVSITFA